MEGTARKELLDLEQRKMKLFWLIKWKHLRTFKKQALARSVQKYRNIKYRTIFVKHIKAHRLIKQINERFLANKVERKQRHIATFMVVQYRCKFARKLRCRGATVKEREQVTGRNVLAFLGNAAAAARMEFAKPIFHEFLHEWSKLATMSSAFDRFNGILRFIVSRLENTFLVQRQRAASIDEHLWRKHRTSLAPMLQHRLATEKQKLLYPQILKVSDLELPCKKGTIEYDALPLERKAKRFLIEAYVLR